MENNELDRLFQEGLSTERIQQTQNFDSEEKQWQIVRAMLAANKRFLPFFRTFTVVILIASGLFIFQGLSPKSIVDADKQNSIEDYDVSEVSKNETNSIYGTEDKLDVDSNINISTDLETKSETLKENDDLILTNPNQLKSNAKDFASLNKIEASKSEYYQLNTPSSLDEKADAIEDDLHHLDQNSKAILKQSISSYGEIVAYGSSQNSDNQEKTMANYSDGTTKRPKVQTGSLKNFINPVIHDFRTNYSYDKIEPIAMLRRIPRKSLELQIGVDIPVHFKHAIIDNSGYAYAFGLEYKLLNRWNLGLNYYYQDINRTTTEDPDFFQLPYNSELYQELDPIKSNIQYNSHRIGTNIYYMLYHSNRLTLQTGMSFELVGRSMLKGTFYYEGVYQPEEEQFEFDGQNIASTNLSPGFKFNYRLHNSLYLTSKYRYIIPLGSGIDWGLDHRIFIGLSYKL